MHRPLPSDFGTDQFLNYLGIQMDSRKAEGMHFKFNLATPDNGEKFVVEMSNATLTPIAGFQADDADLTIAIDRRDLEDVMIGSAKLADKVSSERAKMDGNAQVQDCSALLIAAMSAAPANGFCRYAIHRVRSAASFRRSSSRAVINMTGSFEPALFSFHCNSIPEIPFRSISKTRQSIAASGSLLRKASADAYSTAENP